MGRARVLFVGLDAADKDLILDWSGAGFLPFFRRLRESAAWGVTVNPIGLYEGAIWPSFSTSSSPAAHGRHCYRQIRPGTYQTFRFTPSDLKRQPFWTTFAAQGCPVAVVDVPKTSPAKMTNGIHLSDWCTHDPEGPCRSWPAELASEVVRSFGADPVGVCDQHFRTADEFCDLRASLVKRARIKTALCEHLLRQDRWELLLAVFADSHCAGHQCWHLNDPTHPWFDGAVARRTGNPMRDVYAALDGCIGNLIEMVDGHTTVIVLASHGMGPYYDAGHMLDEFLRKLEGVGPGGPGRARSFLRWGWRQLPSSIRGRLGTWRQLAVEATEPRLDPQRRCFEIPNNHAFGAIRVNLAGREPRGVVQPGSEYEAFCAHLTRELLALVNVDTGRPVVCQVLRTAELYEGAHLGDLPDLLIEWDRATPVAGIASPAIGSIRKTFAGPRTGDHKPEGLFFAVGPGIRPGRRSEKVSIMDFAPTFADLLGLRLPSAEGRPLTHLLR